MTSIDQADKSPPSSKNFEAEPTSPSILGPQWNVDADNLEVCRGIQNDKPVKIMHRAVFSYVSAVFDSLGILFPSTIRFQLLLKSIWKENRQSRVKELNEENRHEFKKLVFVANRVAEILESSTIDQWRDVERKLNPADIGTRGMTVEALKESEWLTGPAWLSETEDDWPRSHEKLQFSIQEGAVPVMEAAVMEPTFKWEGFGSFKEIIRVLSFCLRWKKKKPEGVLSVEELNAAELAILKRCQNESFYDAYEKISKGQLLSASAAKHYVVIKLIEDAHQANFHDGTEYVRTVLRLEYWTIGLQNALRNVKTKCGKCRKPLAGVSQLFIDDLPRER